jgi:hypothetical protein
MTLISKLKKNDLKKKIFYIVHLHSGSRITAKKLVEKLMQFHNIKISIRNARNLLNEMYHKGYFSLYQRGWYNVYFIEKYGKFKNIKRDKRKNNKFIY